MRVPSEQLPYRQYTRRLQRTGYRATWLPGETMELSLSVNTPVARGSYILEIDMLQESVTWFGLAGSKTVKLPVEVR